MLRGLAVVVAAGCSQPAANAPATSPPPIALQTPPDAAEASQPERLAAIQKAINELDEAAQACWAAAATERFDIAGELTVRIEIAASSAIPQVITDTAANPKLAGCLVQVLAAYRWAPPLHGQAIQLPFKFSAPDGQSVIDRRLVEWKGQGKLSVAVLLDENNTGNRAASMLEVAIAAGGSTLWRKAERAELWYFLGSALVSNPPTVPQAPRQVEAGDMMFVPAGTVRQIAAGSSDVHAVVTVVPGGREGAARAGALPTPEAAPAKQPTGQLLRAAAAKTYGPATIYLDGATPNRPPLAASVIALAAGSKVAEHVHPGETELLYLLTGSGTLTIAGTEVAVTSTSVIQIPPNTKHAFAAAEAVRAVQIYTPAGPEQRFKKMP